MTKDEMVGWHYQLDGHKFEEAPGVDDEDIIKVHVVPKSQT